MAFDFLKRRAEPSPEAKASAAGPVIAYAGSGRVAWSPRDTVSLTRQGFTGNPVGFRSVKLIAEAAAALPLVLQDTETRFEVHPMLALMARPNSGQGRAELLEALYGQVLLSGNGYVEAVLGDDGTPVELHVLRSDRMSVVPGADMAGRWLINTRWRGESIVFRWPMEFRRFVTSRRFIRKTTITVCRRCRPLRRLWMCIIRRPPGRRLCWTMPRGLRGPSFTAGRMGTRR